MPSPESQSKPDLCGRYEGEGYDGVLILPPGGIATVVKEAHRLRAENEALQRRLKVIAREVSERLDWIVRDRREPDKVLANVSTTRSVLIRELALGSVETDEVQAP